MPGPAGPSGPSLRPPQDAPRLPPEGLIRFPPAVVVARCEPAGPGATGRGAAIDNLFSRPGRTRIAQKKEERRDMKLTAPRPVLLALGALALSALPALASSHREAPAISKDPTADVTDVYAFR